MAQTKQTSFLQPIRYKLYDTIDKVWLKPHAFVFGLDEIPYLIEAEPLEEQLQAERYVVCQDTGLLDDSGQPIYGGDIVQIGKQRYAVVWVVQNACWTFWDSLKKEHLLFTDVKTSDKVKAEVVGSIITDEL
jgi:hypothetical protein